MAVSITVRPAIDADVPAIQRVARETWHATYAGHIPTSEIEAFLAGAYGEENLRGAISRPTVDLFVAVSGGTIVGYATAGLNREGMGELFAIYVLPMWQGHGAGWRLWRAATKTLYTRGLTEMHLWVLTANDTARRFYERQGAVAGETREWPVGGGAIHETAYRLLLAASC
ncbi:MAG: GNAT family N-acetyltransferase [Thermomicrobiales bacterium]